ncbi:SH3 domain-containing protein [Tepidibacter hydrothermalis]|uniref:SH3 domain-containing protein n=1 Tax=Tepidibacter hydrothermalis TaxID=3036126 RepID=A0ABY8EG43_9FIRM|nr:SH3 domain-containing protein [Tepidibacter hydrothermalis]WFD10534.1 SH3 domain-containing protein [Tepidibacter hydrothermalis]
MEKKKKIFILAISIAFLVVAGTLGSYGVSTFKKTKALEQADALVSMEKYKDGIIIYENMLSKKYNKAVADKRDLAIELMESKENYKEAMELFDAGEYQKSIRFFSRISKNDKKRYGETTKTLKGIEENIFQEIRDEFEVGNQDDAIDRLNNYIKAVPTSVEAKNLKDELKFSIKEAKKNQEMKMEEAKKRAEEEEQLNEIACTAYNVEDTYQTIIAKNANLRVAPKLDADVITTIPEGSECYVMETKVENSERFWCKVQCYDSYGESRTGWVSYNTMNYKY